MKKTTSHRLGKYLSNPTSIKLSFLFLFLSLFVSFTSAEQKVKVITTPGAGTWTVPSGVTSITVECWGGGGAGGGGLWVSGTKAAFGGGGSGGGYAKTVLSVVPGTTYDIYVGEGGMGIAPTVNDEIAPNGVATIFNTAATTVKANGGIGGTSKIVYVADATNVTGAGGIFISDGQVGTTTYNGGNGATATTSVTGGGGSSAGTGSDGTNGNTTNNSPAKVEGGGAGGKGTNAVNQILNAGIPGGGGGGAKAASSGISQNGGNGGNGQIVITYDGQPVDYYVSSTGDDNNAGTSIGAAFLTIDKAFETAVNDDIINVGEGTFTLTTGNFITTLTVKGAGADKTIIQGAETMASDLSNPNKRFFFVGTGSGNLNIENLTLQNFGWWNSDNGGAVINLIGAANTINLTLKNCNLITNVARTGAAIQFSNAGNLVIENCYFADNIAKANNSKSTSINVYYSAALHCTGTGSVSVKNSTFNNNNLRDGAAETNVGTSTSQIAINLTSTLSSVEFVNNTIVNCGILERNSARDGGSIATGPVVAIASSANVSRYINNLNVNAGYTDLGVGEGTTLLTNGLLKNNIFRVATGIDTWAADNSISDTYSASSDSRIDLQTLSTNADGVNYLNAIGTDVVGKGLVDASVLANGVNGVARGTSPDIGASQKDLGTSISSTVNVAKIFAANGAIHINSSSLVDVEVYNISGKLVKTAKAIQTASFEMQRGVYLVKSGSQIVKVVL